ncbi:hypothetical protein GCM10010347_04580 [Streptomyces cirratus]|uniref:Uncharacterized protein n=1 Tax=Streptomyces cirratus TaxID=68187 RepID=A0ABQ3EGA4_9ACTN|nr:hypothetical protein GCM10010347_04580 [Streptomyces cirratus]
MGLSACAAPGGRPGRNPRRGALGSRAGAGTEARVGLPGPAGAGTEARVGAPRTRRGATSVTVSQWIRVTTTSSDQGFAGLAGCCGSTT